MFNLRNFQILVCLITSPAACAKSESKAPDASKAETQGSVRPSQSKRGANDARSARERHFYGVYVQGNKVGWMRSDFVDGATPEFGTEVRVTVSGMGSQQDVKISEERVYSRKTGKLERIRFSQGAATGTVRVDGKARGDLLLLSVEAGGKVTEKEIPNNDTLEAALGQRELARTAKVGAEKRLQRFDASVLKDVTVRQRVLEVTPKVFAGVTANAVKLETEYEELGVSETAWLDDTGKLLEFRIGQFFVARLEPPDVAKKKEYQQDILINAVVRTPKPLANSDTLSSLTVDFNGFGKRVPPETARQRIAPRSGGHRLTLSRVSIPTGVALTDLSKDPQWIRATPFIQSDDESLRLRAKKVVGDASDVATASERLVHFVYKHIRDEYVPAYSNALEALNSGRGDCTEHSVLYVAMARSLGIPSRVAVGIAYWPPGNGFGWHAWSEVMVGDTWYAVDPTWGQPVADATHIKLADGDPAEQARIIMLLGQLEIVDLKAS